MSDDYPQKNNALKYFSIESIFHWKPVLKKENLHEFECEPQRDDIFNFFNFSMRLVKCYQIYEEDLESALDIVSDLEIDALTWSKNKKENLFVKIKDACIHLVFASKMYLLQKNPQQVTKIIDKITPIEDMDEFNQAAIFAVRSAVLVLCSNEGIEKAIIFINKALNFDPDNAQWISLKALYLRKFRENINPIEPPSMMEKELFEAAYKKEPTNVVYKLQVADMYVELFEHILKQSSDRYDYVFPNNISLNDHTRFEADSKIRKALEYYEGAAKKYPESSYVLFCCGSGFLKLPPPHQNIEFARNLLSEGLKKNPKSIRGHLSMALILEKYDENTKKAKWHLEICQKLKSFNADLVMIRVTHDNENSASYGFKALQMLAEKYHEKLQLAVIYSQMVSFYLFIKYDLIKACHYTEKFYQLNTASSCMRIHRSIFLDYPVPFSLVDVLIDEIKYKKRAPRSPESIRQICEDFEIFMCYQNVPMVSGFPQNLRWKILQGRSIANIKCQTKYPDTKTYPRIESKKYEPSAGDQPNNSYKHMHRTDSISEFSRSSENHKFQNGNQYIAYHEQKKWNNTENHRNDQSCKNVSTYLSSTAPSLCEPLVKKNCATKNIKRNSTKKEKAPESPLMENHFKESSKASSSSTDDSDDEKLVQLILKSLKKIKSVREKKSKKSKHRKNSSSSESEAARVRTLKEIECAKKRNGRRKEYYSESDSPLSDHSKKDYRKEYSKKKYHSHADSDYSSTEKRKVHGNHRDSPRLDREKIRSEFNPKQKQNEKKSLKYEIQSEYSSNDEDQSYSNDRDDRKSKRNSRYY